MRQPRSVVQLLQALIQIPSVNPVGDPDGAETGEGLCAQFVARFLEDCGATVEMQAVKEDRPNVLGFFPSAQKGKKRLLFAPHTDTVSVAGMTIDPFGGEQRDGRIYGRGASDTKGPMAAMLWALFEMSDAIPNLAHEIWFAGLMGEETGQEGSRAFVKEYEVHSVVVGEPTQLQIVNSHKGSVWLKLRTRGRAAHSSTPARGENAIYKMNDVIACIRREIDPALAAIVDPTMGRPTINVGRCSGGTRVNIVPDWCEAEVDIRTVRVNGRTDYVADVIAKMRAVCPDLEVAQTEAHPLFTDPHHPMVRTLEMAGGRCTTAPWFCDAAVFAHAGIPAVAIGPGSIEQAHTEDEWIDVVELERGVEFFRNFLRNC